MKFIRFVLGKVILFLDALFVPKSIQRDLHSQALVDQKTKNLTLYQYEACPFCVKVRRAARRFNLKIQTRNVDESQNWKEELVREGGQLQVPCLKIEENSGKARWLYESSDIITYLQALTV